MRCWLGTPGAGAGDSFKGRSVDADLAVRGRSSPLCCMATPTVTPCRGHTIPSLMTRMSMSAPSV